jgi:CDGSH-type Zn-finger protein
VTTPSKLSAVVNAIEKELRAGNMPFQLDKSYFADTINITRVGHGMTQFEVTAEAMGKVPMGRHDALKKAMPDFQVRDTWLRAAGDAVVVKWTNAGTLPDGTVIRALQCIILHVSGAGITGFDIYSDASQDHLLIPYIFSQEGQNMDVTMDAGVKVVLSESAAADTKPVVAQRSPYPVQVEAAKVYWWCACGRSQHQPFCDGSHAGSAFSPIKFVATESKTLYFCGCKATHKAPFCDGTHATLG